MELVNSAQTKIAFGEILINKTIHDRYKQMLLENGMQPRLIRGGGLQGILEPAHFRGYSRCKIHKKLANGPMNKCSDKTESQAVDISMTHNNVGDFHVTATVSISTRSRNRTCKNR